MVYIVDYLSGDRYTSWWINGRKAQEFRHLTSICILERNPARRHVFVATKLLGRFLVRDNLPFTAAVDPHFC